MTKGNLVEYGRFPVRLFCLMLFVRAVDLFLVQSTFVPDEYWQSLEVAHRKVFGYGRLTWEWQKGTRSYLYVSFISGIYSILKYFQVDTVLLVTLLPRVLQAVFSALGDVYFVRWVNEKRNGQYAWALLSWLTCYFISFCSTRTLINTFEMNLTTAALFYYPVPDNRKSTGYTFASIVALLCFIRPTAGIIWIPLIFCDVFNRQSPFKHLAKVYIPVFITVGALSVGFDSLLHNDIVITPWNFFKYNVLENIGEFYGTHDFVWYLYAGLPSVLGLHLIPLLIAFYRLGRDLKQFKRRLFYDTDTQLCVTVVWTIVALSLVPHKEMRFLSPLLPMLVYLSSGVLRSWSSSAKVVHLYVVGSVLIIANVAAVFFLGLFHQVGGLPTMSYLSEVARNQTNSKILFLMPCHSLPLYSHLHANISTRYLTCEPNFKHLPDYQDEADQFYSDPPGWLRREYSTIYTCTLPTHIVAYNTLDIPSFLHNNNYTLKTKVFNSFVYPERTGDFINIYHRKGPIC